MNEQAAPHNPQSATRNPQPAAPKRQRGESEDSGPFGRIRLPSAETPCELPLETISRPADWREVFGRSAPLAVEIGCGGGRTLIGMAQQRPDWDFIGVERAGEYYRILRSRVLKRGLKNLRITRIDAAYLIQHFFADESVREYHIYFPDPWPKKRHHKRRLFNDVFCAELRRTLAPEGVLYFATDHQDYYDELLPRLQRVLSVREHPGVWEDSPEGRTNFEVKYIRQGRGIYRLVAHR